MPDNPIAGLYPAPPQQQNNSLLNNPAQLVFMMSQMNALKQSQQQRAAALAQGAAVQGAIDPTTGTLDTGRALSALANNPDAALGAPEAAGSILDMRTKQIANSAAQLGLGIQNNQAVASIFAGYAQKGNPTQEDVYNAAARAAAAGADPQVLGPWVSYAARNPKGAFAEAANYAMGPAAAASRVAGAPSASGAPTQTSLGATNYGPPSTAVALPPGVGEATTATGQTSGQQYAADLASSSNYRRAIFPLEQALPALESLGPSGTGPGTETFNNVKSFIQSLGPIGGAMVDPNKIANYDIAKKYLTDWVNQNSAGGTNDRLAAAFAGNPSVGISNAAAIDVAKSALALRRMQQAQVLAFQNTGLPESSYSRWASNWQTNQDARAYGIDNMNPASIAKLESTLKGAERNRFNLSLQTAIESGVIMPQGR